MKLFSSAFAVLTLVAAPVLQAMDIEPIFNTPGFTGEATTTIEDKLIDMIRDAKPGSKIRGALYHISRENLAQELVMASHRGVDVEMVLDGGTADQIEQVGTPLNILVYGFTGYAEGLRCAAGQQCVKMCRGPLAGPIGLLGLKKNHDLGNGCSGLIANHNKFFLFSELEDGTKDIVAQTSANMADGQLKMYNDLLLIKNDAGFFEDFMHYWAKLKDDRTVLLRRAFRTIESEEGLLKSYFFPRLVSKDPVKELLKKVSCHLPGSVIKASQSAFTRSGVAREMARLRSEGCELMVIARIDPVQRSPGRRVVRAIGDDDLHVLPYRGRGEGEQAENSIHTKIVMVNASIDGSEEKIPVVLTGSHNLDLFSLRGNDETLIEVRNQEVYDAYDAFLTQILEDARSAGITVF